MCWTGCYLKFNNILCTNQFGFRKNSNTSDAIIEFLDYVYSSLDKKQSTDAVYLDFSKAFDADNHDVLMSKLQHNGMRYVMQSWFKSYLSNRKQYVAVKNSSSSMLNITLDVLQGSLLGPVLFLLCLNDMHKSLNHCALFILLMIKQFVHPTVTLTVFMPQRTGNW